jgi:hypothetical protein
MEDRLRNYPEPYLIDKFPLPTISAADLTALSADQQHHLDGAIVFYGSNFDYDRSDLTFSPVYGELPGVFMQAVAVDNIITLRGSLVRANPPFGLSDVAFRLVEACFLSFLALSLCVVFCAVSRLMPEELFPRPFGWDARLFEDWVLPATLVLALAEGYWLHVSPGEWVGALTAMLVAIRALKMARLLQPKKAKAALPRATGPA